MAHQIVKPAVVRRIVILGAFLATGFWLLQATSGTARAEDNGEWRPYDGGLTLGSPGHPNAYPIELAIDYFSADSNPVRWADSFAPVEICTHQHNRPSWISAESFRATVHVSAQMWSDAGAAMGYQYIGDCAEGERWEANNGLNEIGFDDERNVVQDPAAATIFGTWQTLPGGSEFLEVDIVISADLVVPEQCFHSIVAHELGHGLGFGHGDDPAELMYPSLNPSDLASCPVEASAAEQSWLADLYGVNHIPTIEIAAPTMITADRPAILSVNASDPDGGSLAYEWSQVTGSAVEFSAEGASMTLVAPSEPGAELGFRVDVFDRYRARTSAMLVAVVSEALEGEGDLTVPTFGAGKVGAAVFSGGTVSQLAVQVSAAGGTSVWAQTHAGVWVRYNTLATETTAFMNGAFETAFAAGFTVPTAVFVVR